MMKTLTVAAGSALAIAAASLSTPAGGVPITVDGQVVGAVGVSGAANARQDEELATVAASAVK
jgi:uncharacterized protein GlcG (DUF336 family)